MSQSCECKNTEIAKLRMRQGKVLHIVLWVNAVMFVVEFGSGWLANSSALLGDSLDMLGDTLVYALSLYALHRGTQWRARAGLGKGIAMLVFAAVVLCETIMRTINGVTPDVLTMGVVGVLALITNSYCFALLYRFRSDDINMRSVWLCSRNDLIANTAVILAAGTVWLVDHRWPDILVGAGIALLFTHSAILVIREARQQLTDNAEQGSRSSENVPQSN